MNPGHRFTMVPDAVWTDPRLSGTDLLVYVALRAHFNERDREGVFPSQESLAVLARCSLSTVKRSLHHLRALGHLRVRSTSTGSVCRYGFPQGFTRDPVGGSPMTYPWFTGAPGGRSPVSYKQEPMNHNQEPEGGRAQLFHRSDRCVIAESGRIRILTHAGTWMNYGGGDDEGFRYGSLVGTDARRAAEADAVRARGAPLCTTPRETKPTEGMPAPLRENAASSYPGLVCPNPADNGPTSPSSLPPTA